MQHKKIDTGGMVITSSSVLAILFAQRRNITELLHHAEIIHTCPDLRNLSIGNMKYLNPFDHASFSFFLNPHEIAFVCANGISCYYCLRSSFASYYPKMFH